MPCSEWQRLLLEAQRSDPQWHETMLALNRIDREENMPTLALDLDLSDEQASTLYDLLAERDTSTSVREMSAATPEEAREQQRVRDQDFRSTDAAIRELLGSQKFAQFQEYQSGGRARSQVDRLATALANGTDALQPDQITALTRALYKGQQPVVITADAPNARALQAAQTPHDVAAKVLSPEQLATFDELQRAESARTEAVSRMYSAQREWAQRERPAN